MGKTIQPISAPERVKAKEENPLSLPLPATGRSEGSVGHHAAPSPLPLASNSPTGRSYLVAHLPSLLILGTVSLLFNGIILAAMLTYTFGANETSLRYFGIGWGLLGLSVTACMFLAKENLWLRRVLRVYVAFILFATAAVALSRDSIALLLALYAGLLYYVTRKLRFKAPQ